MKYVQGDVALVALFFSDATGMKKRPVLVLHDFGDDDLLVTPITSHTERSVADVRISEWQGAGLRLPSVVRLEKLATVDKAAILRKLGQLSPSDWRKVQPVLKGLFARILGEK